MLYRFLFFIFYALTCITHTFALETTRISPDDLIFKTSTPGIIEYTQQSDSGSLIKILGLIQNLLLKVALPIVAIGVGLYIAYELFTAEGDEAKMKKAWKSVAYTAVALIAIALSYGIIDIISRLSF